MSEHSKNNKQPTNMYNGNSIKVTANFATANASLLAYNIMDTGIVLNPGEVMEKIDLEKIVDLASAGGSGTIQLGFNADVDDVLAADDADTIFDSTAFVATKLTGVATTYIKNTTALPIPLKLKTAVESITAGHIGIIAKKFMAE